MGDDLDDVIRTASARASADILCNDKDNKGVKPSAGRSIGSTSVSQFENVEVYSDEFGKSLKPEAFNSNGARPKSTNNSSSWKTPKAVDSDDWDVLAKTSKFDDADNQPVGGCGQAFYECHKGHISMDCLNAGSGVASRPSHKVVKKRYGKPGRPPNDVIQSDVDVTLTRLLAPFKAIRRGRKQTTSYPGDIRRNGLIAAAIMKMLPHVEVTLPDSLPGVAEKHKEIMKMAVHLGSGISPIPMTFPPNIGLLVGLRGLLLLEIKATPKADNTGSLKHDETFLRTLNCLFGGWAKALSWNVDIRRAKPPAGTGEEAPGIQITHVKAFVHTNLNGEDVTVKTSANPSDVYDRGVSEDNRACYKCQEVGHIARDCPNSEGGGSRVRLGNENRYAVSYSSSSEENESPLKKTTSFANEGKSSDNIDKMQSGELAVIEEFPGGLSTEVTPKRSTRIKKPVKNFVSVNYGERKWTPENKLQLISAVENYGFNGNLAELAMKLEQRSEASLRYLIDDLERRRKKNNWEAELDEKIDELCRMDALHLYENISVVLELKSLFGKFPDACLVGGVNYAACYGYLASLTRGEVPQNLDPPTKMKFWALFLRFKQEQPAYLKFRNVVFPELKNSPITTFEARTKLKERRIDEWTKENKEAREVIVSDNFENIKDFLMSYASLNPYK